MGTLSSDRSHFVLGALISIAVEKLKIRLNTKHLLQEITSLATVLHNCHLCDSVARVDCLMVVYPRPHGRSSLPSLSYPQ